jgi:O-antigen ligase
MATPKTAGGFRKAVTRGPAPTLGRYERRLPASQSSQRQLILLVLTAGAGAIYGALFAYLPPSFIALLIAPLALLAGLVVWALPDTGWSPASSLERLFFCYFVSLILWPYYLAISVPGMPLIEIRRIFSLLMVLVLLAGLSTSRQFRTDMRDIIRANSLLVKLLLGFVAVQAISILFAADPGQGLATFLKYQFGWTATFFICAYVFSRPGRVTAWALVLVGLAIILSLIGFLESRNQGVLWANHIPWFLQVSDPAMERLLGAVFRDGNYRVVTTFSVSLSLAEFLALTMAFVIHLFVTSRSPAMRIVWLATDVLLFSAILLTQSRNGVVGTLVVHAGYGFLWAFHRWRTRPDSLMAPAIALAFPVLLAGLVVAVLSMNRLRTMTLGGGVHAASTEGRLEQLQAAGPVLLRSPLFGHGPAQGASALGYTNPAGVQSIDSYFLATVLDYGLVGFALYYGLLAVALLRALRIAFGPADRELSYAMPAAVAIGAWIVSKLVLAQEDSSSLMFMILGLVAALSWRAQRAKGSRTTVIEPERPNLGQGAQLVSRSR